MKANMGSVDRVFRAVAGTVLVMTGFVAGIVSSWNWFAVGMGIVFLLTAVVNICPAYILLGVNTCSKKQSVLQVCYWAFLGSYLLELTVSSL